SIAAQSISLALQHAAFLYPSLTTMAAPRQHWKMCELLEAACNTASRPNPSVVGRPPPASPHLVYPSSADQTIPTAIPLGDRTPQLYPRPRKNSLFSVRHMAGHC
ncbi:unnamed protein product, partial [Ectocarpus sp. 12 AP-2014]